MCRLPSFRRQFIRLFSHRPLRLTRKAPIRAKTTNLETLHHSQSCGDTLSQVSRCPWEQNMNISIRVKIDSGFSQTIYKETTV